ISPEEEAKLIYEFNDVKKAYPSSSTLGELFTQQASKTPEQVAVSYQDKQVSYAELEARSNQFANYLQSQCNVEKGDIVAVLLERSENLPTVILGTLKAGAAYLPLDPSYPQERLDFVQTDSNFKVAVTDELLQNFLADESLSEETQFTLESSSADLAYIMYTSGSTGTPKAVMIPQKSVVRLVKSANYYDFSSSDKLISTGAFSFDATTFEYWGMLLNGGELILCDQDVLLDNNALQNEIQTRNVNVMWFTAGWGNQLIDDNIEIFNGLNTVLLGGEKLSPKHIQKLRTQYPTLQIINGYGPTENTTFSLTYDIKEVSDSIPIGKPISNSSVYILNEKHQLQPIGVVGEIYLGGDGLAKGYLNDPDKTAEKFVSNPFIKGETIYKSGDLGMWLSDGNVLYMGRNDNQVKIRGHRIELGEIEQVLQSQESVSQVVVTVKTFEKDQTIVAYILPENGSIDKEGLKSDLRELLPDYMIPNHYVEVTEMPLNANGKVDYKALPELQEADMIRTEYVEASTETESQLVGIWQKLLQLDQIGVRDNFFDIGGHSIKAIKMSHDISTVFELDVSIKNIFVYPTIEQLAAQIDIAVKQQEAIKSTNLNELEI
ncbi:MAG: amino acid adenylation domain-containing protein, partial [Kordia sp.]|uniref:non-ribosomal peptide synthetase n=1 Tax=Kordia sp. TaxID=1965332 RepID=UPI00385E171E